MFIFVTIVKTEIQKISTMKKIVVLMMAIFLVFSINSFSQTNSENTFHSAIKAQTPKVKVKSGRKPRKSVSRKKAHKSSPKRHSQNKAGKGIHM
jgi:hypothetical protein